MVGKVVVQVAVGQREEQLPLLVIKGKGPTLLGCDWLEKLKLNWREVHHIKGSDKRMSS